MTEPINTFAIVADIGGTNARFSRVNLSTMVIDNLEVFSCADFSSLSCAFSFYQQSKALTSLKQAAIAIACPVMHDWISMTNFHWQFSINEVKQQLGLRNLQVLNDFTAAAMSLSVLAEHEKIQIGPGVADCSKPRVVLGAGTGLGVAHLIPDTYGYISLAGEGGHVDWAPQNEQEWFIHCFLAQQLGHVSAERVLSGQGLENIYLALAAYHKQNIPPLNAAEIAHLALTAQSPLALATIEQFFASLGSYAGNLSLTSGAFGGVYIAGGVVPKLLALMKKSDFRARFEAKGRFSQFNQQIPTYVISAAQPGLLGAAVHLKQMMAREGL